MIKVIPFKKEHLEVMDIRDHEDRLLADESTAVCLEGSVAVTVIKDGRIEACYGFAPYLKDIADIWLIPSKTLPDNASKLAINAHKFLADMHEDMGIRRMETLCLDDDLHERWMTFLGFKKEGVKKQYYGGKDYVMWGKLWV